MRISPRSDPLVELDGIVRAHRGDLSAVARSEGLTPEEALECVQDALCTYLARDPAASAEPAARPGVETGAAPEMPTDGLRSPEQQALATIMTMVRNAARNFRRRHRRLKPHEPLDVDHEPLTPATVEELVAHAEDVVRLRACVASLCSVQRAVVMLRLLEERSGEDAAAALGLTRGHVDVVVHRAKAALRVCMRHAVGHEAAE